MRQMRRSGLATLLVTGGALALSAGAAHADSGAEGAAVGSPGVGSGNTIQLPVHVPVNLCGNTVNVVGLLNPAMGNRCANISAPAGESRDGGPGRTHKDEAVTPRGGEQTDTRGGHAGGETGGSAANGGGATAESHAEGSPGVLSGNGLQLPIDLPVNVVGNSVNVVGVGNPAVGNTGVNAPSTPEEPQVEIPTPRPQTPVRNVPPKPVAEQEKPAVPAPAPAPQGETSTVALAATGSESMGYAAAGSAALLLGGALMYRRARRAADQV
ncbi:chaplin family protein [Streptomyces omiyaensis]|uniref:chaplin family protein n=1 Tax=Streptomyces omiyaensis TaxID=68247 RepID=UPI001672658A|nr:chaplin family protein [Streptomyces omiyaensis]